MMGRIAPVVLALLLLAGTARAQPVAPPDTLRLSEAARAALATHPLRGMPEAGVERARAAVRESRSALLPRLATEWSGVRHQEPMIVRPLHEFDPQAPPEFDRTLVQGNVSASWILYDGGARGARIERAEANGGVADATLRSAETDLLARVVFAYLTVLDARSALLAYDAQITALEAERTRVLRFEAEGRVAHVAVLRAEAAFSSARADRAVQMARRARAEAELARLVGTDARTVADAALAPVDTLAAAPADRATLIARAFDSSPRVEEARARLVAAEATTDEMRAAWLPSVTVSGRYSAYAGGSSDLTAEWQGGLQLSYPLFTGGQRSAAVARSEADLASAQHALRLAELEVEASVDDALTAIVEADARLDALDAAVTQYRAVVDVEQLALDAGAGVQTDFLRAQSSLLETETARSAARHARVAARVRLARATGDLTLDKLQGNR